MDSDNLKDWLVMVLKGLVSNPDSVEVDKTIDEQGVFFKVKVASQDRGKVIGRKGAIAMALRTIVRAAGYLTDARASLVIEVPGRDFKPKDDF